MKKISMLLSFVCVLVMGTDVCMGQPIKEKVNISARWDGQKERCVIPGFANLKPGEKYHSSVSRTDCEKRNISVIGDNAVKYELWCTTDKKALCKAAECKSGYYLEDGECLIKSSDYNCVVRNMDAMSFRVSNEYLFPTTAHHNNKEALVCGGYNKNNCGNNQMVVITGTHVHKNQTITDPKIYKCSTEGGDLWRDGWNSGLPGCTSLDDRVLVTTFGDKDIYVKKTERAYGLSGSTYYVTNDVCYAVRGQGVTPGPVKPDPVKPDPQSCKSKRSSAEGKACCDLPTSVATWDGAKCNCVGNNKEFKILGGKGACVVPESGGDNGGVTVFRCDNSDFLSINLFKVNCKDNQMMLQLISEFEMLCNNPNATAEQYNKISNQVALAVEMNCRAPVIEDGPDVVPENVQSRAAVIAAGKVLDGIKAGFDVSVWKNAQGEFNTARLASDSIAAVVLGTAGGLITSSVMKKNQVEDGFEDLKCVIGGQPVAGWGDEFRVGIQ